MSTPDAIHDQILLPAPLPRVWQALTEHREFGAWFMVDLAEPFQVGVTARGPITHAGMGHLTWEALVEALEPMSRFAFRWHPYGIDPDYDYSVEPTTLVSFRLQAEGEGTLLSVLETGFSALPEARRAKAFEMNRGGWAWQMQSIRRYLTSE